MKILVRHQGAETQVGCGTFTEKVAAARVVALAQLTRDSEVIEKTWFPVERERQVGGRSACPGPEEGET